MFINTIKVVLFFRAIDGNSNTQMGFVLLDEPLHFLFMIVNTIRRNRKAIGIEPMMISLIHF